MSKQVYTKELLEEVCKSSYSYAEVLHKVGKNSCGGNYATLKKYIQQYNIDISHFTG